MLDSLIFVNISGLFFFGHICNKDKEGLNVFVLPANLNTLPFVSDVYCSLPVPVPDEKRKLT